MKIAVIGNGNWGTTVSKLVAENIAKHESFDKNVILWTHEETYQGQNLSDYINKYHINPLYLPGIKLPGNIISKTSLSDLSDADVFLFCLPHQFIKALKDLKPKKGAYGINLSKGFVYESGELLCPSEYISRMLGIECGSLSGANIAGDIAKELISDTTIGYIRKEHGDVFRKIFTSDYFRPSVAEYDKSYEICGAVKNIVAVGYGISKGCEWGVNSQSMVFRQGLIEMKRICELLNSRINFLESACIGDLFVSCISGRNSRFGEELGKTKCTIEEFEKSMNNQKLQGPETSKTLHEWAEKQGIDMGALPLCRAVFKICFENAECTELLSVLKGI